MLRAQVTSCSVGPWLWKQACLQILKSGAGLPRSWGTQYSCCLPTRALELILSSEMDNGGKKLVSSEVHCSLGLMCPLGRGRRVWKNQNIDVIYNFPQEHPHFLETALGCGEWGKEEWAGACRRTRRCSCPQDIQNLRRRVIMWMRDSRVKQPTRTWKGTNPIPTGRPKWHSAYFGGRRIMKTSRRKWPLIDFRKTERF